MGGGSSTKRYEEWVSIRQRSHKHRYIKQQIIPSQRHLLNCTLNACNSIKHTTLSRCVDHRIVTSMNMGEQFSTNSLAIVTYHRLGGARQMYHDLFSPSMIIPSIVSRHRKLLYKAGHYSTIHLSLNRKPANCVPILFCEMPCETKELPSNATELICPDRSHTVPVFPTVEPSEFLKIVVSHE